MLFISSSDFACTYGFGQVLCIFQFGSPFFFALKSIRRRGRWFKTGRAMNRVAARGGMCSPEGAATGLHKPKKSKNATKQSQRTSRKRSKSFRSAIRASKREPFRYSVALCRWA
jgi:hypothetical protein